MKKKNIFKITWLPIGILSGITFVLYYPSLRAPFIFDDTLKIVRNPDIKNLANIRTKLIYPYEKDKTFIRNDPSRPVVYLTFALNYYFGKLNPFGYHLFNVFIHLFNGILFFLLTKKIVLYSYKSRSLLIPFFVVILFLVHPINTEAVSYTFARSGSLATFFYISSLLLFLKTASNNKKFFIFSLLCFILSLYSKPIAVTFPVTILIFDYLFLSDCKISKVYERKYYHLSFWLILLFYLLFRYFYLGGIGDIEVKSELILNRYFYIITQPYVILRYIKLLFIPTGLCIYHYPFRPETIFEPKILASFFLILMIFSICFWMYKKRKVNSRIILFSVLWFFIAISPTSSFFPTAMVMAERRLYLSGYGIYLLQGILFHFLLFRKCGSSEILNNRKILFAVIFSVYVCFLAVTTWKRNKLYQNPEILWKETISRYPSNYQVYENLGLIYRERGEYDKAIKEYEKMIKGSPEYVNAYISLGGLYTKTGNYDKAIERYSKALELDPMREEINMEIGKLYYYTEKYQEAIQEFQEVIELNPGDLMAHYYLALTFDNKREYQKAIKEYRRVITMDPTFEKAYSNLGLLYSGLKEYDKALLQYREAIKIDPNFYEARNNLGNLYYAQNKFDKAYLEYKKALEINPNSAEAHNNLGALYYSQKKYKFALKEFEIFLSLMPDDEKTIKNINTLKKIVEYQEKENEKNLKWR